MNAFIERIKRAYADPAQRELAERRLAVSRNHFRNCRKNPAGFLPDPFAIDRFVESSKTTVEAVSRDAWPKLYAMLDEIAAIAEETKITRAGMSSARAAG